MCIQIIRINLSILIPFTGKLPANNCKSKSLSFKRSDFVRGSNRLKNVIELTNLRTRSIRIDTNQYEQIGDPQTGIESAMQCGRGVFHDVSTLSKGKALVNKSVES